MEKAVRQHRKLLEDTALKLIALEIPFNFTNITDEFTLALAAKGVNWVKYPLDALKDFRSRRESVRRYLHNHISSEKQWVLKMMKPKTKEKSKDEISRALHAQQCKLKKMMTDLSIKLEDIENYDESFTTRCGGVYRRSVGIEGRELSQKSVSSHRSGWMNLTIVNKNGVFMIYYRPLTEAQWKTKPQMRYRLNHVIGNVYEMLVPPGGRINRLVHLNVTQRWYEYSRQPKIVVADGAGVHKGKLIELAMLSVNRYMCIGDLGGWTSVGQLCDSHEVHASFKFYISVRASRRFVSDAKAANGPKKIIGMSFHELTHWTAEWINETNPKIPAVMVKYYPPNEGEPDQRSQRIRMLLAHYKENKERIDKQYPLHEELKRFDRTCPIDTLRGVGKATRTKFEAAGLLCVGDLLDVGEEKAEGLRQFGISNGQLNRLKHQAKNILEGLIIL